MSKYKFRAEEVNVYSTSHTGAIWLEVELTTPQSKDAFLTLAGDTRGNELTEWMAEMGYAITEIEEIK